MMNSRSIACLSADFTLPHLTGFLLLSVSFPLLLQRKPKQFKKFVNSLSGNAHFPGNCRSAHSRIFRNEFQDSRPSVRGIGGWHSGNNLPPRPLTRQAKSRQALPFLIRPHHAAPRLLSVPALDSAVPSPNSAQPGLLYLATPSKAKPYRTTPALFWPSYALLFRAEPNLPKPARSSPCLALFLPHLTQPGRALPASPALALPCHTYPQPRLPGWTGRCRASPWPA